MKAFAELLDRLLYTPSRNGKLTLMCNYFRKTPDPDRGYALAALTDGLPHAFPIRRIIVELAKNPAVFFRVIEHVQLPLDEIFFTNWNGYRIFSLIEKLALHHCFAEEAEMLCQVMIRGVPEPAAQGTINKQLVSGRFHVAQV